MFRDSLTPIAAGTPRTLGNFFYPNKYKDWVWWNSNFISKASMASLNPTILFWKNTEVTGTIYCSPPFLACISCQDVQMAFLRFYLWMREGGITNTWWFFISPWAITTWLSHHISHTQHIFLPLSWEGLQMLKMTFMEDEKVIKVVE